MPKNQKNDNLLEVNNAFAINLEENATEESLLTLEGFAISPAKDVIGVDGRGFSIDADKVIKTQKRLKTDIPVYVNHDRWSDQGASGWIKVSTLAVKDNYIVGDIEFNNIATELLVNKQYRYLSPTYLINKKATNDVAYIYEVSLVNHPNVLTHAVTNCQDLPILNNQGENMPEEKNQYQAQTEALEKQNKELLAQNEALQKQVDDQAAKHGELSVNHAIEQGNLAPAKKEFALSLNQSQLEDYLASEKNSMESLQKPADVEANKQEENQQLSAEEIEINEQLEIK